MASVRTDRPVRYEDVQRQLLAPRRRLRVRLEFKAADCWVGVFWKRGDWWHPGPDRGLDRRETQVWVCLGPMLPIHFTWTEVRWR